MLKTMQKTTLAGLVSLQFVLPQHTLAQIPELEVYQEDCFALAKAKYEASKATGTPMSVKELLSFKSSCNIRNTDRKLEAVQKAKAVLLERLAQQKLELDDQNRILDAQGRELAALKERQGELVWVINSSDARTKLMLEEAEAIVRRLAQ